MAAIEDDDLIATLAPSKKSKRNSRGTLPVAKRAKSSGTNPT